MKEMASARVADVLPVVSAIRQPPLPPDRSLSFRVKKPGISVFSYEEA